MQANYKNSYISFEVKTPEKNGSKRPQPFSDIEDNQANYQKNPKRARTLFPAIDSNKNESMGINDIEMGEGEHFVEVNLISTDQPSFSSSELVSIQQFQYHLADKCFKSLRESNSVEDALLRINHFLTMHGFSISIKTHDLNRNIISNPNKHEFLYKKNLLENVIQANPTVKQIASAQLSDAIIYTQLFVRNQPNILLDTNTIANSDTNHAFLKFKNHIEISNQNKPETKLPDELSCMNLYPDEQFFNSTDMNTYLSFLRGDYES